MEIKAVIKNTLLLTLKDSFLERPDDAEITWKLHNTLSHAMVGIISGDNVY